MLQLNQNIKLIRELSGKSQSDFAQLIKTNLSNLKTYENTEVRPKANLLAAISDYAGISVEDLEFKKLTHKDVFQGGVSVLPLGNLRVTLEDYVNEIKRQRDYLERLVVDKSDKIIAILTNSSELDSVSRDDDPLNKEGRTDLGRVPLGKKVARKSEQKKEDEKDIERSEGN